MSNAGSHGAAPLRIVHWAKYYPPEWGGTELVTYDEAVASAAAGDAVEVVAFTRDVAREETDLGVRIVRAKAPLGVDTQPLSWRYFREAIRRGRRADIVHIHTPNLLAAPALLFVPKRVRVILQWQTDIVDKGLLGRLVRPLERYMGRRAEALLAHCDVYAQSSDVLRRFRDKVVTIPLGIADPTLTPFSPALPAAIAAFVRGRPLALAVGRSVPYKGFEYLIRAAAEMKSDTAIVIVGTGALEAEHRALIAQLGVEDRVMMAGRVGLADLQALFRAAACYVMCSVKRSEAYGLVTVEAMAYGLPTIATSIPGSGVAWVAGDGETGLIVPPRDPAALAAAVDQLATDAPARARFGQAARARYERLFTRDKMLASVMALYRRGAQAAVRTRSGESALETSPR